MQQLFLFTLIASKIDKTTIVLSAFNNNKRKKNLIHIVNHILEDAFINCCYYYNKYSKNNMTCLSGNIC